MKKKTGFAILSVSFGAVVALIAAEIVLRLFAPPWLEQKMTELRAGENFGTDAGWSVERRDGEFYSFTPKETFPVRHYEYDYQAHIDSLGGRRTVDEGCEKGEPIVPVLGDSFAFGTGAPDDNTFATLVSRRLDVCLVNLGVPGTGLHGHLDILEARHESLGEPEVYLFTHYTGNDLNDAYQHVSAQQRENGNKEGGDSGSGFLASVNRFVNENALLRRVYLLQFSKGLIFSYTDWGRDQVSPYFRIAHESAYDRPYRSSFETGVEELDEQAQAKGFEYVIVMIPSKWEVDSTEFARQADFYGFDPGAVDRERPRTLAKTVFDAHGVAYVDLTDCLREAASEELYYQQDTHFTPQGNEMATRCMVPALEEKLK